MAELNMFGCALQQSNDLIVAPTLFMDEYGVIVACYLPDILLPQRQVCY